VDRSDAAGKVRGLCQPGRFSNLEVRYQADSTLKTGCRGAIRCELFLWRRRAHAIEEDPNLSLPALEIGAQERRLLLIGKFNSSECLNVSAEEEFTTSGNAQVAYPLCLAPGCYQVAVTAVGEQVHRGGTPLTTRPPLDPQHPRTPDADAQPGRPSYGPVEHMLSHPSGLSVVCHAAIMAQRQLSTASRWRLNLRRPPGVPNCRSGMLQNTHSIIQGRPPTRSAERRVRGCPTYLAYWGSLLPRPPPLLDC